MYLDRESGGEVVGDLHQLLVGARRQVIAAVYDLLHDAGVAGLAVRQEGSLEGLAVLDVDPVAESPDSGKKSHDDVLGLVRGVLVLLQKLVEPNSPVQLLLGGRIEIGAELGEGGNLTVLGKLELHGSGNLLGGLELGGTSDPTHAQPDTDSWALSLVKELALRRAKRSEARCKVNKIEWNMEYMLV